MESVGEKRARFREEEDLKLLEEVIRVRPFDAKQGGKATAWNDVSTKLSANGQTFTARACMDRLALLLKWHKSFQDESARASGVEEEHTVKLNLIDEIVQLKEEAKELHDKQKASKGAQSEVLLTAGAIAMNDAQKRY